MRVAKAEAERFHDRSKDAIGEASKAMTEVWSGFKSGGMLGGLRQNWWGSGDGQRQSDGSLDRAPLAAYLAGPANVPPPVPVPGHPTPGTPAGSPSYPPLPSQAARASPSPQTVAPQRASPKLAPTPAAAPTPEATSRPRDGLVQVASLPPPPLLSTSTTPEDDIAMRHHFAALERMVAMGLSPQAARTALKHMDNWLTSKAGICEMAQSEARARDLGEPILHMGDHVCLEGLVKNAAANGRVAVLQCYVAESQRWKVALDDGKSYLLQAKFLKPIAQKPTAYLQQLEEVQVDSSSSTDTGVRSKTSASDSANDSLQPEAADPVIDQVLAEEEALRKQQAEEMRIQQEDMERRAAELARTEELLDAERVELRRSRASLALVQAHVVSMLDKNEAGGEPKEHRMDDDEEDGEEWNTNQADNDAESEDTSENHGSNEEGDDVWDMDWSGLGASDRGECNSMDVTAEPTSELVEGQLPRSSLEAANEGLSIEPNREALNEAAALDLESSTPPKALGGDAEATDTGSNQATLSSLDSSGARSTPDSPEATSASPEDAAELQRILEEKHRLAELHNGEDLTNECRSNLVRESMPGAHPALAAKLEARKRMLEQEHEQARRKSLEATQLEPILPQEQGIAAGPEDQEDEEAF